MTGRAAAGSHGGGRQEWHLCFTMAAAKQEAAAGDSAGTPVHLPQVPGLVPQPVPDPADNHRPLLLAAAAGPQLWVAHPPPLAGRDLRGAAPLCHTLQGRPQLLQGMRGGGRELSMRWAGSAWL